MGFDAFQPRDSSGRWTLNGQSLPRVMYHITTPERAAQIHREGLKPGSLQTSNLSHNISKNGVYLSSDWNAMVGDQVAFGDVTDKHDTLHVFAVDVGGLLGSHNAKIDDEFSHDDPAHPIIANTEIASHRIRDSFQIKKVGSDYFGPTYKRIRPSDPSHMSESERRFFYGR